MKHIIDQNGTYMYFDKHGNEIKAGDKVIYNSGRIEKVYETEEGLLGTDATNPLWIELGKAYECEYGIYPFEVAELKEIEKVVE